MHHLPSAEHVVILKDGIIAYRGSWDEVQQAGYKLSELARVSDTVAITKEKGFPEQEEKNKEANVAELMGNEYDAVDAVDEETNNPYLRGIRPYIFWFRSGGVPYSITAMVSPLLLITT